MGSIGLGSQGTCRSSVPLPLHRLRASQKNSVNYAVLATKKLFVCFRIATLRSSCMESNKTSSKTLRMIFKTSPALGTCQRTQIEYNALLQEARSIDTLLFKIAPELTETVEFHNTQSKSNQPQKPAKILWRSRGDLTACTCRISANNEANYPYVRLVHTNSMKIDAY